MLIWSLPSSLLAALIIASAESTSAASSYNSSSTSTEDVGAYIVSGLGGAAATSEAASSATSATTSDPTLARIQSCAADYDAYSSSASAYEYLHGHNTTVLNTLEFTFTSSAAPASTRATSFTKLCDGYRRVVGRATTYNASSSLVTSINIYNATYSTSGTTYPGPTPTCFIISEDDCAVLWSAYESSWSVVSATPSLPASYTPYGLPSCTTAGETPSCSACQIVAASARMLYWPVTTVPGSGDLCNKTASTITATPTGPPSSFVTEGLTITSPTVGISFSGLARIDGCGTTVANTIILANREDIATVRGYRSFFSHWQFNFADLNYVCDPNVTSDVPVEERDDCYQAVPADAYLAGTQEATEDWDLPNPEQRANRTIWPDYHPQLLPPETMLPMVSRLWAKNNDECTMHPLGIWDPPVALSEQATADGPDDPSTTLSTLAPVALSPQATAEIPSVPSTTASEVVVPTNVAGASPAQYTVSPAPATALAETTTAPATAAAVSDKSSSMAVQSSSDGDETSSTQRVGLSTLQYVTSEETATAVPAENDPTTTVASQNSQDPAGAIASLLAGAGRTTSPSNDPQATRSSPADSASTQQDPGDPIDTTNAMSLSPAAPGPADPALASQVSSADPASQDGNYDPTLIVALGSSTIQVASASGGAGGIVIGAATLSPGDLGQTIDGLYVSADPNGLVLGSGTAASSVALTQGQANSAASEAVGQSGVSQLSGSQSSAARSSTAAGSSNLASSSLAGAAPEQTTNAASMKNGRGAMCAIIALVYTAISMIA